MRGTTCYIESEPSSVGRICGTVRILTIERTACRIALTVARCTFCGLSVGPQRFSCKRSCRGFSAKCNIWNILSPSLCILHTDLSKRPPIQRCSTHTHILPREPIKKSCLQTSSQRYLALVLIELFKRACAGFAKMFFDLAEDAPKSGILLPKNRVQRSCEVSPAGILCCFFISSTRQILRRTCKDFIANILSEMLRTGLAKGSYQEILSTDPAKIPPQRSCPGLSAEPQEILKNIVP